MVIQHNMAALNSHRNLSINNRQTSKNLEKLSSGYRVNRAADDAAGLAISEKMRAQIRGLGMAEVNADNAINLIQTAEGGLQETHAILQRMRELAVQASNGTYQDEDRLQINNEVEALKSEVSRIAESTHYNNIYLLDGSLSEANKGYTANLYAMTYDPAVISATKQVLNGGIEGFKVDFYSNLTTAAEIDVKVEVGLDGAYTLSLDSVNVASSLTLADLTLNEISQDVWEITWADPTSKNDTLSIKITVDGNMLATAGYAEMDIKLSMADRSPGQMTMATTNGTFAMTASSWEKDQIVVGDTANTDWRHLGNSRDDIFQIRLDNWSPTNANSTGFSTWDAASSQWVPQSVDMFVEFNPDGTISYATINGTDATIHENGSVLHFTDDQGNKHIITIDTELVARLGIATYTNEEFNYIADIATGKSELTPSTATPGTYGEMTLYDLDRMAEVEYNEGLVFQIGANGTEDQRVQLFVDDMSAEALGIQMIDVKTRENANDAIDIINDAIMLVSDQRARLGALQNRLEHTLNSLGVSKENLTAAESTIRDVDMAKEMMEFTTNNILVQASQAMLAQANQLPQGVLSLLR